MLEARGKPHQNSLISVSAFYYSFCSTKQNYQPKMDRPSLEKPFSEAKALNILVLPNFSCLTRMLQEKNEVRVASIHQHKHQNVFQLV